MSAHVERQPCETEKYSGWIEQNSTEDAKCSDMNNLEVAVQWA